MKLDLSPYDRVLSAIGHCLVTLISREHRQRFAADARLNDDLYLDSVLVMQLLVMLETDYGLRFPDERIGELTVETVDDLVRALLNINRNDNPMPDAQATPADEEFDDIKVHCFVSCLCEIIKQSPHVDHRPFYFGVWDAEVVVTTDHRIAYHTEGLSHDKFCYWFQRLYGVEIKSWYDPQHSKGGNIRTLIDLVAGRQPSQQVMVMLDLFRLPERENKYNQNPFPHYVLLTETDDPSRWRLLDHDFRWQGDISKAQIFYAIESPAVAGGYHFDSAQIEATQATDIRDYFQANLFIDHNPMTDAVRRIVHARQQQDELTQLGAALHHLPVLAIRKYAYEHGFAFFWRSLALDDDEFEAWCERIAQLVNQYKRIHYLSLKLAAGGDVLQQSVWLEQILDLLDAQDVIEFGIKRRLQAVFENWCESVIPEEIAS
jgi:acyl carrier protein